MRRAPLHKHLLFNLALCLLGVNPKDTLASQNKIRPKKKAIKNSKLVHA